MSAEKEQARAQCSCGSVSVPISAAYTFYDKRVADVDDALPKYEGYWASQWAFRNLLKG